jgi:hypothetical protein
MERRELPPITSDTGRPSEPATATPSAPELRSAGSPAARRLAVSRLVLALAALGLALGGGFLAARLLRGWLHGQPQYRLRFLEIVLEPPPPAWYRGGAAGFLERVRARVQRPETVSLLDEDLGELRRDFRYDAWVKKVDKVEVRAPARSPGDRRLLVRLVYRKPVAVARRSAAPEVILDGDGVILAGADIDRDAAGPLIVINGEGLAPPVDPRPGEVWKSNDGSGGLAQGDPRVLGAARLADFLTSVQVGAARAPAVRFESIYATDPRGLWARTAEKTWILWGEPPGAETPGRLRAEEKWAMLRNRVDHRLGALVLERADADYWEFSPTLGLIQRQGESPRKATPAAGPRRVGSGGSRRGLSSYHTDPTQPVRRRCTSMGNVGGERGHGESTGPELVQPGAATGNADSRRPVQPLRRAGRADQRAGANLGARVRCRADGARPCAAAPRPAR